MAKSSNGRMFTSLPLQCNEVGDISGKESVSQSFNQIHVEFMEIVFVAFYSRDTGVFLAPRCFRKSSDDLSHSNSALRRILESKIRQDQKASLLAEKSFQIRGVTYAQPGALSDRLKALSWVVCTGGLHR
jgi:hypothetical protein